MGTIQAVIRDVVREEMAAMLGPLTAYSPRRPRKRSAGAVRQVKKVQPAVVYKKRVPEKGAYHTVGAGRFEQRTRMRKVLSALKLRGKARAADLATATGLSPKEASRTLYKARDEKKVQLTGSRRGARWSLAA
jgi:hypothetical protein